MRWMQAPARYRRFGAVRSALIAYGVAAFTFFWSRTDAFGAGAPDAGAAARALLLWGVGVQILMIVASRLVTRYAPDPASAEKGLMVLELIADGITVTLFAIATFGAILRTQNAI